MSTSNQQQAKSVAATAVSAGIPDKTQVNASSANPPGQDMLTDAAAQRHPENNDNADDFPEPPDGGYGWIIVMASFFAHLIGDGCGFSFGVMFAELIEAFDKTRWETAWVGSVFVSMPSICGPIASACIDRIGCRWAMIIGSLISSVGCFASAFVGSIGLLCFTFGIIAGFGLSLVFLPATLMVAFYFEERRAFATGLSVAGSGIGTFLFAPLIEFLIKKYGWQGALIVLAGIMLNLAVCGALLRPLVCKRSRTRQTTLPPRKVHSSFESLSDIPLKHRFILRCQPVDRETCPSHVDCHGNASLARTSSLTGVSRPNCENMIYFEPVTRSVIQFPTYLKCEWEHVAPSLLKELDVANKYKESRSLVEMMAERNMLERYNVSVETRSRFSSSAIADTSQHEGTSVATSNSSSSSDDTNLDTPSSKLRRCHRHFVFTEQPPVTSDRQKRRPRKSIRRCCLTCCRRRERRSSCCTCRRRRRKPKTASGPVCRRPRSEFAVGVVKTVRRSNDRFVMISRRDVFYRGALMKARYMVHDKHVPSASCPVLSSCNDDQDSEQRSLGARCRRKCLAVIGIFADLTILSCWVFNYFCLHNMLLFFTYDIPYVYLPDSASNYLIDQRMCSLLVSTIGISNTLGQILMGYIGDHPRVDVVVLYSATTSIAGLVTLFVPLLKVYYQMAIYCALYGFFISANYALRISILVDLLGMKRLTNAFGLLSLSEGLANLIGPPIAGMAYDWSGSYDITFYLCGSCILVSGLMVLALPTLSRVEQRRKQAKSQTKSADSS